MARVTEALIERRRGRMIASLFLLVVAFAIAFVILSFADPDIMAFLHVTPAAGRIGFLALTFGLLALVWEKEREYRRLDARLHRERLLSAAFRSRIDVLETLLQAGDPRGSQLVRSRFLAAVSHELRTPLTSIIGFSQTLEHHWEHLDDEKKAQAVQAIESESHRLWRVVERILDAARVELEGVTIEPRFHDVRRTMEAALQPFREEERSRIALLLPKRSLMAEVDPFVLNRTISNLVDNALRYTEGDVQVVMHAEKDQLVVRVHDHGPGLSPDQVAEATQPLLRVEENVKSGTGLGLHVVRTLVAEHGGNFEMSSDASGTTVLVNLPRYAPHSGGITSQHGAAERMMMKTVPGAAAESIGWTRVDSGRRLPDAP